MLTVKAIAGGLVGGWAIVAALAAATVVRAIREPVERS